MDGLLRRLARLLGEGAVKVEYGRQASVPESKQVNHPESREAL